MFKKITPLLFLLFASIACAQKIGGQQLEYTSQLNSLEEKVDFFLSKGFAQESKMDDKNIKLVRKLYQKRSQEFDYEIITIANGEIIYTLIDPKKSATFKKMVSDNYKRQTAKDVINDTIIFTKIKFTIKFIENEIQVNEKTKKAYNFVITNNKNSN